MPWPPLEEAIESWNVVLTPDDRPSPSLWRAMLSVIRLPPSRLTPSPPLPWARQARTSPPTSIPVPPLSCAMQRSTTALEATKPAPPLPQAIESAMRASEPVRRPFCPLSVRNRWENVVRLEPFARIPFPSQSRIVAVLDGHALVAREGGQPDAVARAGDTDQREAVQVEADVAALDRDPVGADGAAQVADEHVLARQRDGVGERGDLGGPGRRGGGRAGEAGGAGDEGAADQDGREERAEVLVLHVVGSRYWRTLPQGLRGMPVTTGPTSSSTGSKE